MGLVYTNHKSLRSLAQNVMLHNRQKELKQFYEILTKLLGTYCYIYVHAAAYLTWRLLCAKEI